MTVFENTTVLINRIFCNKRRGMIKKDNNYLSKDGRELRNYFDFESWRINREAILKVVVIQLTVLDCGSRRIRKYSK